MAELVAKGLLGRMDVGGLQGAPCDVWRQVRVERRRMYLQEGESKGKEVGTRRARWMSVAAPTSRRSLLISLPAAFLALAS